MLARPAHASADKVRDAERASYRGGVVGRRPTIASHGIAGLDDQAPDLTEAGTDILRESVREIHVGGIVREVVEVQHRHARRGRTWAKRNCCDDDRSDDGRARDSDNRRPPSSALAEHRRWDGHSLRSGGLTDYLLGFAGLSPL